MRNLNEMYLNNYKVSASYSEQTRLLHYMETVAKNLARAEVPRREKQHEHDRQIPLFPERELFGA